MPPSVIGTCALINGIICQLMNTIWPIGLFSIMCGELLHRTHQWSRTTAWLSIIVLSCFGAFRVASQQAHHLTVQNLIPYGLCSIEGEVLDIRQTKNRYYPYNIRLRTHRITSAYDHKKTIKHPITVQITLRQDMPLYPQGAIICLSHVALFKNISSDQEYYLIKNNLHCTGKTTTKNTIRLIQIYNAQFSPSNIRQTIIDTAYTCFSPQTFVLMSEMFFGYSALHSDSHSNIRELFGWWGLNHLLARSGLHLVMFILLFGFILSRIPLPFLCKHVLILMVIFLYTLLSWPSISFIRAIAMMVWYTLCIGVWAAPHPLHVVACITIGVLCYQPCYLMSLDFQLSFALTFTLALISHSTKISR
jgi:hypothetical protein